MRKVIFLVSCFLLSVAAISQGVLKGKLVIDTIKKQPLSLATITVFKAKDTSIVTYRLSDGEGNFKVPGLPYNLDMRVVITASGYKVYRKEFTLSATQPQLELGILKIDTDTAELDEVLVYAERPPVSIKKDTIEFNASAFKTLPTSVVEDLLRKLPGVEVDPDGNIKVNGRTANRILVDSKDFFGGDPKVATRNLPANLIDKVQVVDDAEQLERNPEINKSELGVVINLKFKKSIKKGWFGKAYAGAGKGSTTHYETGAIINSFRDTLQVSLLGYSNNLNKAGFGVTDLEELGGFKRSNSGGNSGFGIWNDGGISMNGISFGGTDRGLQRSTGGGININHDPNKKLNLNFQYFYGSIVSDYNNIYTAVQFIRDTTLTNIGGSDELAKQFNHKIGLRLGWKIDSVSTLNFRPSFTLRTTNATRDSWSKASSNFDPKMNETNNHTISEGKERNYSHELSYRRSFKKKGRNIFINNNLSIGNNDNQQVNDVSSVFYTGTPSIKELNQLRQRDYNNQRTNTQITYNEPLTKTLRLQLTNNFTYFNEYEQVITNDWDPLTEKYVSFNDSLSNEMKRKGYRNNTALILHRQGKKVTFSPGIQLQSLNIDNSYRKSASVNQGFFYLMPTLNITAGSFNVSYNINVNEPSAADLRPVPDNTNPLYIIYGNKDLKPTKSHGINLNYYKYDRKHLFSWNAYANLNLQEDAIVRNRSVDNRGVQTTRPVNVDGVWTAYGYLSLSKQYKFNKNVQLSVRPGINGNLGETWVIVNNTRSRSQFYQTGYSLTLSLNFKDKIEWNQRYNYGWRKSKYENNIFKPVTAISHNAFSEVVIRMPKNWVWENAIDYRYNPQVAAGISKHVVRWNAGVNYLFLKENKGQLKLSAYDLLKQNRNVYRSLYENSFTDSQSNTLTRYFMLSFTYNIRDFKGGKVGGRNMFYF
jgi:hypothetical protein